MRGRGGTGVMIAVQIALTYSFTKDYNLGERTKRRKIQKMEKIRGDNERKNE